MVFDMALELHLEPLLCDDGAERTCNREEMPEVRNNALSKTGGDADREMCRASGVVIRAPSFPTQRQPETHVTGKPTRWRGRRLRRRRTATRS